MDSPKKTGIAYFSFDVNFESDPKLIAVWGRYGITGSYVFIHLLSQIYREGYYLPFDEDDLYVQARHLEIEYEKFKEMFNYMIQKGLFDADLFHRHGIITSAAIQKRWQEAVGVRCQRGSKYKCDYWLLPANKTASYIEINQPMVADVDQQTVPMVTDVDKQAKEKERSKEKEIKVKQSKEKKSNKETLLTESKESDENVTSLPHNDEKKTVIKKTYGEECNVALTDSEYEKLQEKLGNDTDRIIEYLSEKKAMKGYKYKSDYRAILNWVIRVYYEEHPKNKDSSFDEDEFFDAAVKAAMERHGLNGRSKDR